MSPKSSQSKFCLLFFPLMVRTCGLRRLPAGKVLRASCQARLGCNSTSHQKTHKHMWDNSSEHAYKAYQAITKKSLRRCLRNMFPQKVLAPAYAVQAFAYAGSCYDTTIAWHVTVFFRAAHLAEHPSREATEGLRRISVRHAPPFLEIHLAQALSIRPFSGCSTAHMSPSNG